MNMAICCQICMPENASLVVPTGMHNVNSALREAR